MKKRYLLKKYKTEIIIGLFILFFPIIVGLIYNIPCPQIIAVEVGDLLAFYGTAGGIFASFVTYRNEKKKEKNSKRKELMPSFAVVVEKTEENPKMFRIKIRKLSESQITYVNLYDEYLTNVMEKENVKTVTYCLSEEELEKEKLEPDFNITCNDNIIDPNDNYPEYVQIICEDMENNCWSCCYFKINNGNEYYYYPREIEVL